MKICKKKSPKRLQKDEDRGGGSSARTPFCCRKWSTRTSTFVTGNSFNYKFILGMCIAALCLIEKCWAGFACLSNPCIFGVCIDDINSTYSCYCIDGYTGIQCQTNWDECWSSPCKNGGTCIDGVAQYNCTCPDGFAGLNCEENLDECLSNPCQNGATCHDKNNGYVCTCQPGYTGDHCETDVAVCETGNGERCHNGGECNEGPGLEFSCKCATGWTSQYCDTEINECESAPCQNGGVCVDKIASYACACPMEFTGTNCEEEILKCENSPCQNNALCLMEEGIPICYCVPDYHGEQCELQYDECQLGPRCTNGGVCIDGIDSFTCSCPPGLTGTLCECLVVDSEEINCNYTAPTAGPTSEASPTTPGGAYPETTFDSSVPTTFQYTTPDGEPATTTLRSRFSSTPFHTLEPRTFRTSTGSDEFHHSTLPSAGHTHPYTDEGSVETSTADDGYTRFGTRPTPGPIHTTGYTTYEPTKPVPTDAPDHITHFFTEFPRTTTEEASHFDTTTTESISMSTTTTDKPETATEMHTELPDILTTSTTEETTTALTTTTQVETTTVSASTTEVAATTTTTTTTKTPDIIGIDCGECKNGASCSSTSGNPKCVCPFNYQGNFCEEQVEIRRAAFGGDSYVSHRIYMDGVTNHQPLDEILPLKIELKARTRASDGLIILAAAAGNKGGHYMALFLHRGLLQFQFSCGLQTMLLSELEAPINSGLEFLIQAELDFSRNHSHCNASLRVNDTLTMSGDQPTWLNPNPTRRFGRPSPVPPNTASPFLKNVWLHLGGAPQLDQTIGLFNDLPAGQGFTGCLHSLKINGKPKEIFLHAFDGFNVQECGSLACLSNPCRNGATCVEDHMDESENDVLTPANTKGLAARNGDKWHCKCPTGFMGSTCEVSICDNNPCQYGGTCVPFPGSGYLCLCPLGKHGHYCEHNLEITIPAFSGTVSGLSAYLAYPLPIPLEHSVQFKFKIAPTTMQQISLLAFIGQNAIHDDKSDHLAVSFIQGYIMLTWNLGAGPRRIFTQKPVEWKTDGTENVYEIEVARTGRFAWLTVDGAVNISGNAPGAMSKFEVHPMLYLGGHQVVNFSTLPHDLPLHSGFQGCVFDLTLISGHISIPLLDSKGVRGRGVGQCGTRECHRHACQHDGACLQHGATFTCICQEGWHGPLCAQSANPCEGPRNQCNPDSMCVPLVTGYECDCPVGKVGKFCGTDIRYLSDVSFSGRRSFLRIKWPNTENDVYFGRLLEDKGGFRKMDMIGVDFMRPQPMMRLIVPTHAAQQSRMQHFSIEFQIRPLSERGLLLFFGDVEDNVGFGYGFVSVSLAGGVIEYRTSGSQGMLTVVRSSRILAIGEWHKVKVIQAGRRMTLWVEGTSNTALTPSFNSFVDSRTQLFIGGMSDLSKLPHQALSGYPVSFRGCFRQLTVSGVRVVLNESTIVESKNIADCDGTACGGDSCDAGGHCWVDERATPHCKCPETAQGLRCELPAPCNVIKCKNQGECLPNGACSCSNGWGGYFCEIATSKHSTPAFNGHSSYMVVPPPRIPVKEKRNKLNGKIKPVTGPVQVAVNFSTISEDGLLFWSGPDTNYLGLGLNNGHIRIVSTWLNRSLDVPSAGFLADGGWHTVKIEVSSEILDVYVDGRITYTEERGPNSSATFLLQDKFYIGGFPHNESLQSRTRSVFAKPFSGCIDDIDFGHDFIAQQDEFALFEGRNIAECETFDDFSNG